MTKSTSTCHSNRSIFALGQASCSPSGRIHHTHRMPNPHFARFSPGPFGTSSLMDLMGNSPQGEDTPPLEIGEQLTTKAVNAARRRRMLAQCVDFHRFSPPSSASTCSLCSIVHSSARCVLELRWSVSSRLAAGGLVAAGRCAKNHCVFRIACSSLCGYELDTILSSTVPLIWAESPWIAGK